ncbi:MAG: hypothetical protein E7570_08770 [Ruminococcaceae bacterium]|nr:hypothetical protein [Oscillospiraceae bacterium]
MISEEKIGILAQQIKNGADVYSRLIGQTYLIIYNNTYVEVVFKTSNFKHLTGVGTTLSAEDFYRNALNNRLMGSQIFFNSDHPYRLCKKKVQCVNSLEQLLKNDSIIVEDIITAKSRCFKIGLTDLSFTVCFSENCNVNGNILNTALVPHSLRVKDDAFNKSSMQHFVDCILSMPNNGKEYANVVYGDINCISNLPNEIKDRINLQIVL